MENANTSKVSKLYLWSILLLMLIIPVLSTIIETEFCHPALSLLMITGKWFLFWAIGVRLLTAGVRQVVNPGFTAQQIFNITDKQSGIVVIELGFANCCFGAAAILSLIIPSWRPAAAFAGGLYIGIAGIYHIIKKPSGANEWLAMFSDIYITLIMAAYLTAYYM